MSDAFDDLTPESPTPPERPASDVTVDPASAPVPSEPPAYEFLPLSDEELVELRHPQGPPPAPGAGALVFFKDNLEAFAIAIVMALVIKHFCVEAFKIPTASMEPTLLGEERHPPGDRILVNKFAYLFGEPQRWEIPVFRYPLDRSRNFIKRIGGLPGELLRIHGGDLWVRRANQPDEPLKIARKNRRVREALYFAVYPPPPATQEEPGEEGGLTTAEVWRVEGNAGAWVLPSHTQYDYVGGAAASIVLREHIHKSSVAEDWPRYKGYGEFARDVRVRARIVRGPGSATDDATSVTLSWSPDGEWRARLTLSSVAGQSEAVLERSGQAWLPSVALDTKLGPKQGVDVELEFVDGDMHVWIDGAEVAVIADQRLIEESVPSGRNQELRIEATGAPLSVQDVRIDRDLFYMNSWSGRNDWKTKGVEIPEDCYFMLGDNTDSSSDSRKWQIGTVHLKDGHTIRYEADHPPEYITGPDAMKQVKDVDGILQTWSENDEDPDRGSTSRNFPFVWRDLIVGRAFVIFWPLSPRFPGRLRFIH